MHGPRSSLPTILVPLLIGALALAGCNSNSVSGNQPKASNSTNAEGKASPSGAPKGLIDAAVKKAGG
jgi:hypothetical protein